jgi:hypothetical protein
MPVAMLGRYHAPIVRSVTELMSVRVTESAKTLAISLHCEMTRLALLGRSAQRSESPLIAVKRKRYARREPFSFCRVGPGNFTPSLSQIPDLILSHHPARAIARRLPPSAERSGSSRFDPVGPSSTAMTRPLRSTGITPASSLLQGSPPLSGASVLSASRLEPLAPFPLASPARFSRSIQEPD